MEIKKNNNGFREALVNSEEFDRFISLLWRKVDCRVYYKPIVIPYLERQEQIDHSAMQGYYSDGADFVRLEWISSGGAIMASMKINGCRCSHRGAAVRGAYKIHREGLEWLESNGWIKTTTREKLSF